MHDDLFLRHTGPYIMKTENRRQELRLTMKHRGAHLTGSRVSTLTEEIEDREDKKSILHVYIYDNSYRFHGAF